MSCVLVDTQLVKQLGSNAALIFAQISYWLTKAKGGKSRFVVERRGVRMVAHSRDQIGAETGLSPKQVRNGLETLKANGLIRIEQHLFEARNVGHIVLAQMGHPELAQTGSPELALSGQHHKYETEEEIIEDLGPAGADPEEEGGLTTGNGGSMLSPWPKEGSLMKKSVSVADVLAGTRSGKEKTVSPEKAVTPSELELVFRRAWSDCYEDWLPAFYAKQHGQLKQLSKMLPPGKAGVIIDHVVRNWPDFVAYAKAQQGAFNTPSLPNLGFMMTFVQSMVSLHSHAKAQDKPAPKTVPAPPKDKKPTLKPVYTQPDTASIDDVAKLLGFGS